VYELNDDVIVGVQILATLDDRTTPICQGLDGRIFKAGEAPMPPYHIGCWTTTVPVLDEAFAGLQKGATRIAKGPNGTEIVSADMTYYEWLKAQPKEFQNDAIGPTRAKLLRDGGLDAKDVNRLSLGTNFAPLSLEDMRAKQPWVFDKALGRRRLRAGRGDTGAGELSEDSKKYLTFGAENSILDKEGVKAVELKRIEGEWSDKENLEAINPERWMATEGVTKNCGNCAVANELRHQGYDVEARIDSSGMNINELADMFDGAKVQYAARISTTDVPSEMKQKVEQDILTWGEGARGAIRGNWLLWPDGAKGHLFSLEVRDGVVTYDDGQNGEKNVKYLESMKPQTIAYVRLDNTKPNDKILKAVKNRRT